MADDANEQRVRQQQPNIVGQQQQQHHRSQVVPNAAAAAALNTNNPRHCFTWQRIAAPASNGSDSVVIPPPRSGAASVVLKDKLYGAELYSICVLCLVSFLFLILFFLTQYPTYSLL